MIKQTSSSVGYVCNNCGRPVINKINFFNNPNELLKLKCGCGRSELTLKITNDSKVRLTVPCILCGANHIYNLSISTFFTRDVFELTCSLLNVNICALGKTQNMNMTMSEICQEINKIFQMYSETDENYRSGKRKNKNNQNGYEKSTDSHDSNPKDMNIMDLFADFDIGGENSIDDFDDFFDFDNDDDEYDDLYDYYDDKYDDDDDLSFGSSTHMKKNRIDYNMNPDGSKFDRHIDYDMSYRGADGEYKLYKNRHHDLQKNSTYNNSDAEIFADAPARTVEFKNKQQYEKVLYAVAVIVKRNRVVCDCSDRLGSSNISMILEYDRIRLICKNCGCSRVIKASTSMDVEYVNDLWEIALDEKE